MDATTAWRWRSRSQRPSPSRDAGIDAIEVSCTRSGNYAQAVAGGIDAPEKEAYFASQAKAIRQSLDVPIILVGGLRSRAVMQNMVNDGICDMVSMCRPFICEPDLVNRMETGRADRSSCTSCGKCFSRDGIRCILTPATGRRRWWGH